MDVQQHKSHRRLGLVAKDKAKDEKPLPGKARNVDRIPMPLLVAGKEVLGRQLAVFKNTDKNPGWVKGAVKDFDEPSVRHKIQYDQPLHDTAKNQEEWLYLGRSMFMWRDEDYICPAANPTYSLKYTPKKQDAIGKRVKVFWTAMGKWYQGKVVDFDSLSGRHRVSFRDGDEKRCMLRQEALVWLDIPELSSEAAIKKMRQEEGEPIATAVIRDDENQEAVEPTAQMCSHWQDDSARGKRAQLNVTNAAKAVISHTHREILANGANNSANGKHLAVGKGTGPKALGNKVRVCNGKAALKATGIIKPCKLSADSQQLMSSGRALADRTLSNGKAVVKKPKQHQDKLVAKDVKKMKKPREAGKGLAGKVRTAAISGQADSGAKTAASGSKEPTILTHRIEADCEQLRGSLNADDSKSASSNSNEAEKVSCVEKTGGVAAAPKLAKALAKQQILAKGKGKLAKAKENKSRKRSRLGVMSSAGPPQPAEQPDAKRRLVAKAGGSKPGGPAAGQAAVKLGRKPRKVVEESRLGLRRQMTVADNDFESAAQAVMGSRVGVWWEDDACYYKGKIVAHDWYHKRLRILYDDGVEECISPQKQETQFTWLLPRAKTSGALDAVHAAFQLLQAANAVQDAEAPSSAGSRDKGQAAAVVPSTADGSHLDALVPLRPSSAGGGKEGEPRIGQATPYPVDSTTRAVSASKQAASLTAALRPDSQLRPSAGCNLAPLTGLQAMIPSGSLPLPPAKGLTSAAARKLAAAESCPVSPSPLAPHPSLHGSAAEGWKVSIVFRGDKQIFQGRILCWDEKRDLHHVLWDDGEDEWIDVKKEQLGWHADRLKATGFSAGLPSGMAEPKGHDLEGWRIAVYWKEEQQFFQGTVEEYDSELDQHTISYSDGDELCESLQGLVFKYVLPPTVQPVASRLVRELREREEPERRPRRRARAAVEESEEEAEELGKSVAKPSLRHPPRLGGEPGILTPRASDIRRLNSKQGSLLIFEGEDNHVGVSPATSPKAAFLPEALLRPSADARGRPLLVRSISSLKSSQGFRVGVKRVRVYLPGAAKGKPSSPKPGAEVPPGRPNLQLILDRITAAQHSVQFGLPAGAFAEPAADAGLDGGHLELALAAAAGEQAARRAESDAEDALEDAEQTVEPSEHVDLEMQPVPQSVFDGNISKALASVDCPEMSEVTSLEQSEWQVPSAGTSCRQELLRRVPELPPGSMSLPATPSANSEALPDGPSRNGSIFSGHVAICQPPH